MKIRVWATAAVLALLVPGRPLRAQISTGPTFDDVTAEAGVAYPYTPDNEYSYGPGAAFGDWDNDGDVDLYITRDSQGDLLFRNDGSGNFTDVTGTFVDVPNPGCGTGVAWGDVDNDGDLDLFVANAQASNVFYENQLIETGTPNLVEMTTEYGFNESPSDIRSSMGASWVDFNLDGRLDLYVANYIFNQGNYLYQQRVDGFFVDQASLHGVQGNSSWSFMSQWTDIDVDGDMDLYVVNDFSDNAIFDINRLYRNQKKETGSIGFLDITASSGDMATDKGLGMGVSVGDFNRDELLDIFVTNFDHNSLYVNNGDGTYSDTAIALGVSDPDKVGWGAAFVDYDNDRDDDLMFVNGWIASRIRPKLPHPNRFFRNNNGASYTDVSSTVHFDNSDHARGLALGDIDMDGDMDAVVTCVTAIGDTIQPVLYRNDGGNNKGWIGFRLFGIDSNRQGIGARIEVDVDGITLIREIYGGSSFLCQHTTWPLFGLGSRGVADQVRVFWPSGTVDQVDNLPGFQYVSIVEGMGPVAVTLQTYEAISYRDRIVLEWAARNDGDLAGFALDRRRDDRTSFSRLASPDVLPPDVHDAYEFVDRAVEPGRGYEYRLSAHYEDGRVEILGTRRARVPRGEIVLEQNKPNPFNPTTEIRFELESAEIVSLAVYDMAGRHVRTLLDGFRPAGAHGVIWDGRDREGTIAPSGVYFYRLVAGRTRLQKKMILLK